MDIKTLNRANELHSLIETQKEQLDNIDRVFLGHQVKITSAVTSCHVSLTGIQKDSFLQVLQEEFRDRLTEYEEEFNSL